MGTDNQETMTITMKQALLCAEFLQREVDDWMDTYDSESDKEFLSATYAEFTLATQHWAKRDRQRRIREWYLECEKRVADTRTSLLEILMNLEGWRPRSYRPETLADLHTLANDLHLALEAFTHAIKPEGMEGNVRLV